MGKTKKKSPKKKIRRDKNVFKRFVIFFCLLGAALFLASTALSSLFSKTNVLGERIYLASNPEQEHEQEQQEEYEKKKEEYLKYKEKQKLKEQENPKVYCRGPEGKKYKTTKDECEKISEDLHKEPEFEIIELQYRNETAYPVTETEIESEPEEIELTESTTEPIPTQSSQSTTQSQTTQSSTSERTEPLPQTPIEVQAKDSGETIDINSEDIEIELEQEDGHIVAKATQTDGTSVTLMDDALFHIEERLAIDNISLGTTSANEFLIQKNNTAAVTNFPLSWDLTTNTLIVTTPAGRKSVPVLPDAAIKTLVDADEIDQAIIPESLRTDRNVHLGTILDIATLTHKNGDPIYQITGIQGQKLFGLFPVAIEKTVAVSGESGQIVGTNETVINKIIDLLSG